LTQRLAQGGFVIGQIAVMPIGSSHYDLRHQEDRELSPGELDSSPDPLTARQIAHYDAAGEYRPLKGAPTLRRGWRLELEGPEALREALDAFYPAALALWVAWQKKRLQVIPMAQTLDRQTGMYRFARTISAEGAARLRETQCGAGCSRQTLWAFPDQPVRDQAGRVPLLCPEACSFFVAAARVVAKAEFEAKAKEEPEA
jgi:sirohydrochlorin cobaltochelatase